MFTGIIESIGVVESIEKDGSNKIFCVDSPLSHELHVDQSLSHNGVCLTVTKVSDGKHWVTAIDETLQKSNLGLLKEGDLINLERSMTSGGRFDGHIVQGHVDQTATCKDVKVEDGSWVYTFEFENKTHLLVEKGSVCVNGISLTCFDITDRSFKVAIIPYTYENTNLKDVKTGSAINLEFDIVGKYIARMYQLNPERL